MNNKKLEKFNKIYYDTYDKVLNYTIYSCSNVEDVNDILQNIYLDIYKNINKIFKLDNYKTYIMSIAKNKVKDYYRYKYKHTTVELNKDVINILPSDINIEKQVLKNDDINYIWNYLTKKDVIISKIFYLYYYEEKTLAEISKILGLSLSNVKNYLYRTIKELNSLKEDI